MEILNKVIGIIAEILGKKAEEIKKEDKLTKTLGVDELDGTEIVMALEETYNISIGDEDYEKVITVENLANLVATKVTPESGDNESGNDESRH